MAEGACRRFAVGEEMGNGEWEAQQPVVPVAYVEYVYSCYDAIG